MCALYEFKPSNTIFTIFNEKRYKTTSDELEIIQNYIEVAHLSLLKMKNLRIKCCNLII